MKGRCPLGKSTCDVTSILREKLFTAVESGIVSEIVEEIPAQ